MATALHTVMACDGATAQLLVAKLHACLQAGQVEACTYVLRELHACTVRWAFAHSMLATSLQPTGSRDVACNIMLLVVAPSTAVLQVAAPKQLPTARNTG
jgi:hypothetical protein